MIALATVGKFSNIVEAFGTQWRDAALAARDAKARKSEPVEAAVDKFDLSGPSEAASRIEIGISWSDTDPHFDEYGMESHGSVSIMMKLNSA